MAISRLKQARRASPSGPGAKYVVSERMGVPPCRKRREDLIRNDATGRFKERNGRLNLARVFKKLRNDFVSSVATQAMMSGKLLLERGERAVEVVGGVGDVEFRILLIGEQIRKVPFQ